MTSFTPNPLNLDTEVLSFLNQFAQKSQVFDHVVTVASDLDLLKGAVLFAILWALWLIPSEKTQTNRKIIVATLTGCAVSILFARLFAMMLPFRARPINEPDFHFLLPFGEKAGTLETWSSFPSDHAALFFGLVTGLFMISRSLGAVFLVQVSVCVIFPRLYLGLHYPTDILAGAVLGVFFVWLMNKDPIREKLSRPTFVWMERHPFSFNACFFLAAYQFVTLFDDVRALGRLAVGVVKAIHGGSPWEN